MQTTTTIKTQHSENLDHGIQSHQFSSFQFIHSVMANSLQPYRLQHSRLPCPLPTPGAYTNSSIESVMPSNHMILCLPLFLLPSIFASIRVFSNELVLHIRWPKYWHFRFSISPSNEYSGLISFRVEWLDHLAVQGTLKTLNTTVQKRQFFSAQFSLWSKSHIHT